MNFSELVTSNGIKWNVEEVRKCITLHSLSNGSNLNLIYITNDCNFSDDVWDFSKYNIIGRDHTDYIYNFTNINHPYKYYAKIIVLKSLFLKGTYAPTSAQTKLVELRSFFRWLNNKNIVYLELIDIDLLVEYFNEKNFTERSLISKKCYVREFLTELTKVFPTVDFSEEYKFLNYYDKDKFAQEKENNKFKLIPYEAYNGKASIFDTIISLALQDLNNTQLSKLNRQIACMIILIGETGIRLGEFQILQINKLISLNSPSGKCEYYLEFITYKTSPEVNGHWTITYMTPNAVLAYKTLEDMYKEERIKSKSNYLYVSGKSGEKYAQQANLWIHNVTFFSNHQDDFDFDNMTFEELDSFRYMDIDENDLNKFGNFSKRENIGKRLYYITAHQYRVTVATILYHKLHLRLEWIRIHMNHLSEEMTQHYIRSESFKRKQINLVETLIKRASSDGHYLEVNPDKIIDPNIKKEIEDESIKNAYIEINDFLDTLRKEKRSLNIYKDINDIIRSLFNKQVPLSENSAGFCASDVLIMLCERQEYLNMVETSYDLGIQIPTIETLPLDMKRYKDKVEVIKYNKTLLDEDEIYSEIYEKEVNKLKSYIEKRLIPELCLLESELALKGIDVVVANYKEVEPIIENIDIIKMEIEKWMKI